MVMTSPRQLIFPWRRQVQSLATALTCAALVVVTGAARANGRFPEASQLVLSEGEQRLTLRATFGLVRSEDAGKTWGWVCEEAQGYSGLWDPPLATYSDGSLLLGMPNGLRISDTSACGYSDASPLLADHFFADTSVHRGEVGLALFSDGVSAEEYKNEIWRRQLGGSFEPLSQNLPTDITLLTLDIAPSDSSRLYLTGLARQAGSSELRGQVLISKDGGGSFSRVDLPGSRASSAPYLAAVDPMNAERLYVRLDGAPGRLLQSDDGGETWSERFVGKGQLAAFAIRPDGKRIAVGGPADGVWVGDAATGAFERRAGLTTLCLAWGPEHLFACGNLAKNGFNLGRSGDEGGTFTPLFYAPCLEGPLMCPAGSSVDKECTTRFEALKPSLSTISCDDAKARFDGAGGGAGSAGDVGTLQPPKGDDCSCSVPGQGALNARWIWALPWVMWAARTRLRRGKGEVREES